jgi:hypothetical protein
VKKTLIVLLVSVLALLTAAIPAAAQSRGCGTNDDRINYDTCGAPVAIYLRGDNIIVLAASPDARPAQLAVEASRGGPIPANGNVILAEGSNPFTGKPVIVSRLTTGEYQLNTQFADGREYIAVWYTGPDLYTIDPITGEKTGGAESIVLPGAPNPTVQQPPTVTITDEDGAVIADDEAAPPSVSVGDAEGLNNCRVTITRIVRLRTEPNTTSEIIARLPFRSSWEVTERTDDWFRVIFEDRQGWVSGDFVSTTGDCGD